VLAVPPLAQPHSKAENSPGSQSADLHKVHVVVKPTPTLHPSDGAADIKQHAILSLGARVRANATFSNRGIHLRVLARLHPLPFALRGAVPSRSCTGFERVSEEQGWVLFEK
jgi:hypothetical protein